jgi:hypothetical protein
MATRLDSLFHDLVGKLQRASAAQQRAASLVACQFAIAHAKIEHPLIEKTLNKVRVAGILTAKEKGELDALTVQLNSITNASICKKPLKKEERAQKYTCACLKKHEP